MGARPEVASGLSAQRTGPPGAAMVQLEHVGCDLCGSAEYRVRYRQPDTWTRLIPFEFPVVECRSCGLVYVNPRPTQESMRSFYPPGYHTRGEATHEARYALQTQMLPDLSGKRLLDLGCAEGDFLRFLRRRHPGATLCGMDFYAPPASVEGVELFRGDLSEAPFPAGSFDIVTAWAVLEHVHAPLRHFREIHRLLAPGGRFLCLVTNAESLYGRRAHREDIPRHLHHFSERTLHGYAGLSGFRLESCLHDDSIFDGRGTGSFWHGLTALAGAGWERRLDCRFTIAQKVAARLGGLLDRVVFATHWEALLGRSGIVIATFVREERTSS